MAVMMVLMLAAFIAMGPQGHMGLHGSTASATAPHRHEEVKPTTPGEGNDAAQASAEQP